MSDEEFLARWSRLKREARAGNDAPQPAEPTQAPSPTTPSDTVEGPQTPEVDLSSLPPIDSIGAGTDITAFLRKGIPQELSRAALRRAWTADPAIRDFVGLAENAWDFNDPNAMLGFGPLDFSQEQLATLVDRIVGGVRGAADAAITAASEQKDSSQPVESKPEPPPALREADADLRSAEAISTSESPAAPAAAQPDFSQRETDDRALLRRRTHGSALPR